jgi:hypothetical protein
MKVETGGSGLARDRLKIKRERDEVNAEPGGRL